jgi:endonuclease-3
MLPEDNKTERAVKIITVLRKATEGMPPPAANSIIQLYGKDPFLILISCLLSLRARDSSSLPASIELFKYAKTPQELLKLSIATIEKIIHKTGFYHRKALLLHAVSKELIDRFNGKVPATQEELLSIKGVGPKTANLVLGLAFDIPAICVDTHVHRISNRLGLVQTKTPEETEQALKKVIPQQYWIEYNKLLVMWGQNICVPISPFCSACVIRPLCERRGVTKSR